LLAYQTWFFDSSDSNQPLQYFAHFKKVDGTQQWDYSGSAPHWFDQYYLSKAAKQKRTK
jgi:hypothetical protein